MITVGAGAAVATLLMLPGRRDAAGGRARVPRAGRSRWPGSPGSTSRRAATATSPARCCTPTAASALHDIFVRRYELAFNALKRGLMPFATAIAVLTLAYGIKYRDRIYAPLAAATCGARRSPDRSPPASAGSLSNDSGPLLLVISTFAVVATTVYVRGDPRLAQVDRLELSAVRIALVSPYSWTYPGGVTRHIEALAGRFLEEGHHVRVLRAVRPARSSGRAPAQGRAAAGRVRCPTTWSRSGARSASRPTAPCRTSRSRRTRSSTLRRELAAGDFDVVHVHEPVAPVVGWDALMSAGLPLVGTFHCYSDNRVSNNIANLLGARRRLNRLHVRIAVSEAAAWTGRRFYGGHYRVIPNGVDVPDEPPVADPATRTRSRSCSSARRSSARACRSCCAPSRRCARRARAADARRRRAGGHREPRAWTTAASRRSARSTTRRRTPCWRARTCCARRRWAARASAWC